MIREGQTFGDFLAEIDASRGKWGSDVEIERRRRIHIAAYAYAYEIENAPIVDDATFDAEALLIRPDVKTGRADLDEFFRSKFAPHTGQWIHEHPEKDKLKRVCEALRRGR